MIQLVTYALIRANEIPIIIVSTELERYGKLCNRKTELYAEIQKWQYIRMPDLFKRTGIYGNIKPIDALSVKSYPGFNWFLKHRLTFILVYLLLVNYIRISQFLLFHRWKPIFYAPSAANVLTPPICFSNLETLKAPIFIVKNILDLF